MESRDLIRITGRQLQAARVFVGLTAEALARSSSVGVATIRRAEAKGDSPVTMTTNNIFAVVRALDEAGVVFVAQNGGGPGVRLK